MNDGRTLDGAKKYQLLTRAETVSRANIAARQIRRKTLTPVISLKRWPRTRTGYSGDSAQYLWR